MLLFGNVYDAYGEMFRVPLGVSRESNALLLLAARSAAAAAVELELMTK